MNGKKVDFALVREERGRIVIGYGLKKITGTNLYEWYEIYVAKTQINQLTFQMVKDAIISDINERTQQDIIGGMTWQEKSIWLSLENQSNISAECVRANQTGDNLPLHTKVGEEQDGTPVYLDFETAGELTAFWNACQDHITACRQEGWAEKDDIDWAPYEKLFPQQNDGKTE